MTTDPTPAMQSPVGQAANTPIPPSEIELANFVALVREFLRDYPELNRLTSGVEHSNRQIIWAIFDAIDEFNTTPPYSRYYLHNFPSRSMLLRAVTASLCESLGLLHTRNQLPFSDGGLQVTVSGQTPYLQNWISMFRTRYETWRDRFKVAKNIEEAWGPGVASEYTWSTNWYGAWALMIMSLGLTLFT